MGLCPFSPWCPHIPDKPICCGSCQLTKDHSDLVPFCSGPCSLPRPHLTPHDPCHTRSWHILPRSFTFRSSSSKKQALWCWCVWRAKHRKTSRQPWRGPVPIYTASRWCLSIVWQEGVLSNCVKPHIVKVDKESLLSSWYKVQMTQTRGCVCVSKSCQQASGLWMNVCVP